jgi:RNA polymerase sigma-70 factor (ECF subfamily)
MLSVTHRQAPAGAVQSTPRLRLVGSDVAEAGEEPRVEDASAAVTQPGLDTSPRADESLLRELVERIRAGDRVAFDRFYCLTRRDVARTLQHLVGRGRGDIEDLLQETYLQLLTALRSFRGEASARTFVYRVCANVALMHLRWRRRRPEESTAEPPEPRAVPGAPDPESEAARREAARMVEEALEALGPKKRLVFVYHELCGLGPEEIGRIAGTSPNTVRSRLHHARLEFHEAMRKLMAARQGGADGVR